MQRDYWKELFLKPGYFFSLVGQQVHRVATLLKNRISFSLTNLYDSLKVSEVSFFIQFLLHDYSTKQFDITHVPENLRLLFRLRSKNWVNSTRDGRLYLLTTRGGKTLFSLKNFLLGGALQKRVERVVLYTYLTLTLELNNPFNKKTLLYFLHKKIALMERILDRMKTLNGKAWDQTEIRLHIEIFHRNSLLQAHVIETMHLAVKRQKEGPVIKEAKEALKKGLTPVLITQGLSGAYWMRGTDRKIVGLFKPFDEEIHAPNNPVGPYYRGAMGLRKTRRGCRVGESAHHEVAAFIVDEFFGFGIVPRTYYAQFTHRIFFLSREDRLTMRSAIKTKIGSFQEFVEGFASVDKLSREERESIPLDEFQLLVVLDVIIGNTDRNIGNILFGDEKIAAIDHGLCFPDTNDYFSYWYWSFFEQGERPLFKPIRDLLNHFPFEGLEQRLKKKCFISLNSLHRMRERVALFTEAINLGLAPAQLQDLFVSEYLTPLLELNTSLKAAAAIQAQLYKDKLPTQQIKSL